MALEAGGYAEKMGHRYEANWIAFQLLQLLEEKINWITIEPIGDDEHGVDIVIENKKGELEHHQCKVSKGDSEHWTFAQLNELGILKHAYSHIVRGTTEFHVVSPLTGNNINQLCESALNSNGIPEDFIQYQINTNQKRAQDFKNLCGYLDLDSTKNLDILKALNFLRRLKITTYSFNSYDQSILRDRASALFFGEASNLINFLKNYPEDFNRLRNKIILPELLLDLEKKGFEQKIVPDDKRVSSVINKLSEDFIDSIEPFLISKTLIQRDELQEVVSSITDKAVTLIKAEAGMGKSALLLELHNYLQDNNFISIPIRLDRKRPENNADAFGESLGFVYSPVQAVSKFASHKPVVFILDQLDAIRWTASHSNHALDICKELVRQIIYLRKDGKKISVVLASRSFDVNEDVALSSWLDSLDKDCNKDIQLSALDDEIVKKLIALYENYSDLTEEKKDVLKMPLWLGIYLSIVERIKVAPKFNNKLELIKKYWEDRFNEITSYNIVAENAIQFIDEVVALMISRGHLSVPENLTPTGSQKLLELLISIGLFSRQNQQISFRHQALFDYQVGMKLFNAGSRSSKELLLEIGSKEVQTLTNREHLRYALNMLLESGQKEFSDCVEAILFNENVRYHLKYLALNVIREINFLRAPMKKLIEKIILSQEYLQKFLVISCRGNVQLITYLINQQKISEWLKSSDDELINISLSLLSSIVETDSKLVINELEVFIGKSKEWNQRIYKTLPFNIEDDSDEVFELRKELINLGCKVNYIDWELLVKNYPLRAFYFIELILERYRESYRVSPNPEGLNGIKSVSDRDEWSIADLEKIKKLSRIMPEKIISTCLEYISKTFDSDLDESLLYSWLYRSAWDYPNTQESILRGIFILLKESGKNLEDSEELAKLLHPYMESSHLIDVYSIANLLLYLPIEQADIVIRWLLSDLNTRLRCGNKYVEPNWILAGKLIYKYSPHCSLKLYSELESKLYHFFLKDFEQTKIELEATRYGRYYNRWGEAQYFLLPMLDKNRVSIKSKELISVLNRKFSSYKETDFCYLGNSVGGAVVSPLPLGNKLSNKNWRKLILQPDLKFKKDNLTQVDKNTVSKATIETFSGNLQYAVSNEPIHFANFALSLPKNIHKEYINAFFNGLAVLDNTRVQEEYKNNWEVCPFDLLEKVILHFYNAGVEYEESIVTLLMNRAKDCSEKMRDILISFAKYSKDPEFNQLNVWDPKRGRSADRADIKELAQTNINSVRGRAYRGIVQIFWKDEIFALQNLDLIEYAINDEHPSIKISAMDLLLPILNYDEEYAHSKFIELCDKDLRISCIHGAHYFFNQGFGREYLPQYIALVLKMLKSPFDDVRKEAAKQVYARWFFYDLFQKEVSVILQGDKVLRSGCASVISQFLSEDQYHDKIHKIESAYEILINDEESEIQRKVVGLREKNYWKKPNSDKLFKLFVNSKAVETCLFELFYYLEESPKKLSEISELVLQLIINIIKNISKEKSSQIFDSSLFSVLQKIYDEATEDEDSETLNICLDIWDELFKSDTFTTMSIVNKLDKGLLS